MSNEYSDLIKEAQSRDYVFSIDPFKATIGDLIELKEVTELYGKALGHSSYTSTLIRIALVTELGEVLQEVKSNWAWWKKIGDSNSINEANLIEEIADVMHFFFLGTLFENYDNEAVLSRRAIAPAASFTGDPYVLFMNINRMPFSTPGSFLACVFSFSQQFNISSEVIIQAYLDKGRKNVKRWMEVLQQ